MSESKEKTKKVTDKTIKSTPPLADEVCASIRDGKSNALGLLDEYFEIFAESMGKFSQIDRTDNYEQTIENIENFLPYRDEIIRVFSHIARYLKDEDSARAIHKFFERVIPYCDTGRLSSLGLGSVKSVDADNFRFLVHEMFLYAIAALMRKEKFEHVAYLIDTPYYAPNPSNNNPMVTFDSIRQYVDFFKIRNIKMQLGDPFLRGNILMDRVDKSGFDPIEIMQADFVLTIKSAVLTRADTQNHSRNYDWYPDTCLHAHGFYPLVFEIFARGARQKDFDKIKVMLGVDSKDELADIIEIIGGRHEDGFENAYHLANIKNLCQTS